MGRGGHRARQTRSKCSSRLSWDREPCRAPAGRDGRLTRPGAVRRPGMRSRRDTYPSPHGLRSRHVSRSRVKSRGGAHISRMSPGSPFRVQCAPVARRMTGGPIRQAAQTVWTTVRPHFSGYMHSRSRL